MDELLAEAEARLAVAQQEKDSKLGKLPAIILLGEAGSAKTTTMVQSGAEPESLAGQVYEDNNILPTPAANFWFAHHTVFVEMGVVDAHGPQFGGQKAAQIFLFFGGGTTRRNRVRLGVDHDIAQEALGHGVGEPEG